MKRIRKHASYANVAATIAVVLAIGGGTTAIAISSRAAKNSVTTGSIRNGDVTAKDLAGVRVVTRSAATGILTASCGAKERLVGGGANQEGDPQARFFGSYPDGNGWTARTLTAATPGVMLTVYALCLKAVPGR